MPRSLVQRTAWAAFVAIAGSAACVAFVSVVVAERFAVQREERQLTNAAAVLAVELVEPPGVDPLFAVSDEARELRPTGIRLAVYDERGKFFAGDAELPRPDGHACRSDSSFTVCGVSNGQFLAVAARDTMLLREERRSILIASLLAAVLVSLLGAFFARRIARTLVSPLSRLRTALDRVPTDAPETVDVGKSEGVEEVDALREALRATLARLGDALATSRRFAADAAHELRSPLTVILGELELNARSLTGEEAEANERARRTAARLSTLVNRLLVLASPASKLEIGEELELQSAVDDGLDLIPIASWPRVNVTSEAEAYVRGDRALLAAMIANAIENGLKFSEGEVRVQLRAEAQKVEIQVTDEGPGILKTDRERVFEPFFRTRATRASGTPGHGIGLSLIAHVSAVHGGEARFMDRDRGTCLVIELPRAR